MKFSFLFLVLLHAAAFAAPVEELSDFTLTDQNLQLRKYRFPKAKVTAMTVADHKGSDQLAPWIQRLRDLYEERIDIDGVADVSMIPRPFHGVFREAFRREVAYSVMLDWGGSVVKQFAYTKGVANIYVVDRGGRITKHVDGPMTANAMRDLTREIDRALVGASPK
jgi:hypothetical protein